MQGGENPLEDSSVATDASSNQVEGGGGRCEHSSSRPGGKRRRSPKEVEGDFNPNQKKNEEGGGWNSSSERRGGIEERVQKGCHTKIAPQLGTNAFCSFPRRRTFKKSGKREGRVIGTRGPSSSASKATRKGRESRSMVHSVSWTERH